MPAAKARRAAAGSVSPTKRSLAYLRKQGYTAAIVEHWNPFAKQLQDLFGFVDIVAIKPGETLGVQTTSRDHVSDRLAKIGASEHAPVLRAAGWRIVVHGWGLMASGRYELREVFYDEEPTEVAS